MTVVATTRHGRCLDCGDEWDERDAIAVCPECHSTNVAEIKAKGDAVTRVDLIELHVVIKPTTVARAERIGRELAAALEAGGDTLETLVTKAVREAIVNVNLADVRGEDDDVDGEQT